MNPRFKLDYYSHKWGRIESYRLDINKDGWLIGHISINGQCDKKCSPHLYDSLKSDKVKYPDNLMAEMEKIFKLANTGVLDDNKVQDLLNKLGQLVENMNPKM
jgi:hypothetical protein